MRAHSPLTVIGLVAALLGTSPSVARATEGDLDPSFGTGGIVTTDFGRVLGLQNESATAVAIQEDGRIVAAGSADAHQNFGLARYNSDGSLDPNFGIGGTVVSDFGSFNDKAFALVIQDDGRIVLAGDNGNEALVARFEGDGTLDLSFKSGPVVAGWARGLALQRDGKLVVAGSDAGPVGEQVSVMRLEEDGSPDSTFGNGGRVLTPSDGEAAWGTAVAVQADGRIVVVGGLSILQAGVCPCDVGLLLVRYHPDGSLDQSFGAGGVVTHVRPGERREASGMVIQPDGRIVVAGYIATDAQQLTNDFLIARFEVDGSLDPAFGTGGEVITDFGAVDQAGAVALQADGKIVAAGRGLIGDPFTVPASFAVARYHPGGMLDTSFGAAGKVLVSVGTRDAGAGALAIQRDGNIVAVGGASSPGLFSDFALIRLIGTPPPPVEPIGLVNPAEGRWHLRDRWGSVTSFYYGNPGDVPLLGDWDCDGVDTPGVHRRVEGAVHLRNSSTQGVADLRFFIGDVGDVTLAGDWDGDGCDTISLYRPSDQRFYISNRLGGAGGNPVAADYNFVFGDPGDAPVAGDWDGDGVDEVGLHRESSGIFYYRNTLDTGTAQGLFFFGDPGDRLIAGDWGRIDGIETPAVFRPSSTTFYFRHTLTQGMADSQLIWGQSAWLPVSGVVAW